jgi:hypothetical protein
MPPILQYIQNLLAATPFKPFVIKLDTGERVEINTATACSFPISGQALIVAIIKGYYRAFTDQNIEYVELTS